MFDSKIDLIFPSFCFLALCCFVHKGMERHGNEVKCVRHIPVWGVCEMF